MIVAEASVLLIDPNYRLCYHSNEKPLAFFKYYTQVPSFKTQRPVFNSAPREDVVPPGVNFVP
jgi:hypothetical protein